MVRDEEASLLVDAQDWVPAFCVFRKNKQTKTA